MADVLNFPTNVPDYLADVDARNPEVGEHGVKQVHVSLLRSYAGDCAIDAAKAENPAVASIFRNRERWFDEAANALERFLPRAPQGGTGNGR